MSLTSDLLGWFGELRVHHELNIVKLFGRKGKVLRNIYIPKDNGETSEIDVAFITCKGIFVIESKNYSGWIFGNDKHGYWTASLPNGEKNKFYNPVKQNRTHIKCLGEYLKTNVPFFSIIVFSERCELMKITLSSEDIRVVKRDRLYATVRDIWENSPDVLDDAAVIELFEQLKPLTKVDKSVKKEHIEQIENKFDRGKQAAETTETKEQIENKFERDKKAEEPKAAEAADTVDDDMLICPKCGSTLVLRTAKRGENAGNTFYGCSAFPKCRYIKENSK